ncbi:sulfonate ABC transporter permease, partial [Escherichia coli]
RLLMAIDRRPARAEHAQRRETRSPLGQILWLALVTAALLAAAWLVIGYVAGHLAWHDAFTAFGLGLITMARVLVLIALASLVWVPIGVWIGLRPRWAERL